MTYRVPTMAEVQAVQPNGCSVVSTFSGGGGSCLGYRMAGFKVRWASEFIPAAQETYRANFPETILDTRDIREVRAEEILQATGMKKGELDLFDGSPPCSAFSTNGKREKGWGQEKEYSGTTQRVDDLFFEYTRLLADLQPKTFIAENVSGLVKGSAKGYFKLIYQALKDCGYQVRASLVDASWVGVPQARERLIFMGIRSDLAERYHLPPPTVPVSDVRMTFRDALYGADAIPGEAWDLPPDSKTARLLNWCRRNKRIFLKEANLALYGKTGYLSHTIARYDQPVPTIIQGSQAVFHPTEMRTLSIPEVRRCFGFPDDFVLTGSFHRQWERMGRSVPPLMMKAVSSAMYSQVLAPMQVMA